MPACMPTSFVAVNKVWRYAHKCCLAFSQKQWYVLLKLAQQISNVYCNYSYTNDIELQHLL